MRFIGIPSIKNCLVYSNRTLTRYSFILYPDTFVNDFSIELRLSPGRAFHRSETVL